jgi:hypothetical protein
MSHRLTRRLARRPWIAVLLDHLNPVDTLDLAPLPSAAQPLARA